MPTKKKKGLTTRRESDGTLSVSHRDFMHEATIEADGRHISIGCQRLTPKQWLGARGRKLIGRYIEGWELSPPAYCSAVEDCLVCKAARARYRAERRAGFSALGRQAERLLVRLAKLAEKQRELYQRRAA